MNAQQYAQLMERRARLIEPEFRKTTRGLAIAVLRYSRERMTALIYAFPVPRRPKSGKPAYRRTGALRRAEMVETPDAYTFQLVNHLAYAEPRHEAGKPGRRKVRHPAHWRDEVIETFRSIVVDARRLTIRKILGLKGGV